MGIRIDINAKDLKTLLALLQQYLPNTLVWAFGSRVKYTAKPTSDLDLVGFITEKQKMSFSLLKEALAESSLPFRVDLHDWNDIPETFRKNIEDSYLVIQDVAKRELPNDWKTFQFGDLAELRKEQIISNGIEQPYIGLEHIEQQNLRLNGIGSSDQVISNKFKFYAGDVLYGRLRPYFRKVYYPKFDGVCSTEIFVIKNKKVIDKTFLYYLVATEEFTNLANSGSSGTHMPRADWRQIVKSEWNIPKDIETQKQIVQILSSLDDKIELNLQMNKTLEAMTQAIFKEWFVDFKFPGFDGVLVDGLPKGWKITKLSSFIEIKHGFAFKGEFFSDIEEDNILLTPGNFKIGGGFNNSKFKYYRGDVPTDYILERNDLIVTMTDLSKAGDTLGFPALVPPIEGKQLLHNQRIGKVIFRSKLPLKYYLYLVMCQDNYRHFVLGGSTGSTVKHTSPKRICDFEFLFPDKTTLFSFETMVKSLLDKQQENEFQISYLAQIRDALLSKLMSGQLKIN